MFRLFRLAARNLKRSWFRTCFTVLGAAVALIAFIMIRTVLWAWHVGSQYAAQDRLGTRHKVSYIMSLPKRYIDDIRVVPGVTQATWANWFGGRIATKPDDFFANFAVDPKSYLTVMDELVLDEQQKQAWFADRKGCIVGAQLAKKNGWKVGDKIVLEGTIFPGDWEFDVSGIYTSSRKSVDESSLMFQWDYLNESVAPRRRDNIGWIISRISDGARSGDISASIDRIFDERDTQTTTMSERSMQLSFLGGFSALLSALDVCSIIILGIMLLIVGNTIAMGVRERSREYAVLRAIGFEPWHIRFVVISEAATLGLLSAIVGVGLAYPFVNNVVGRALMENMGAWFPYFRVEPAAAATAVAIAFGLAAVSSILPSLSAGRASVTDALRRVG